MTSSWHKQICLERKKVNIDAENEIEPGVLMADRTSYILVREVTLGIRAKRLIRSWHEHFRSHLHSRQVNR
jgi:hypothetical protein